jgi:D-xylose transport system permease protein
MNAQTRRLAVMAAVLVAIAIGFHALTGSFLTAENLYNIAQQTAVVGIVASGMALVIVARQIDLAVGSLLGAVGVLMAWLQYTQGWSVAASLAAGLGLALAVGLFQGWLSAVVGIPSFVVTLGGLVSLRGVAFLVADGKTQPVTEPWLLALGGGIDGSLGERGSWLLGVGLVAVLLGWQVAQRRALTRAGGVPGDAKHALLKAGLAVVAVFGSVAVFNAYKIDGQEQGQGLPLPLVIWGAVVLVLGFVARHTRFGRYVYAIGGNPDAARCWAHSSSRASTAACC